MHILLLGATGKTGMELLKQALEAGHTVTAVARTPSKITMTNPNLTVVSVDVTNAQSLASAMTSSMVLMSALGNNRGSLITDSTKAIIAAADTIGMKRVIVLSSFVVEIKKLQSMTKLLTGIILKNAINDKSSAEALLRASDLDWTIVYATVLTNTTKEPAARVTPDGEKLGMKHKVSRASVAAWMLKEAESKNYARQNVTISQ
jgi:putative NADH-flavin reductase